MYFPSNRKILTQESKNYHRYKRADASCAHQADDHSDNITECLALQRCDVDLRRRTISVRKIVQTKTEKSGQVFQRLKSTSSAIAAHLTS